MMGMAQLVTLAVAGAFLGVAFMNLLRLRDEERWVAARQRPVRYLPIWRPEDDRDLQRMIERRERAAAARCTEVRENHGPPLLYLDGDSWRANYPDLDHVKGYGASPAEAVAMLVDHVVAWNAALLPTDSAVPEPGAPPEGSDEP